MREGVLVLRFLLATAEAEAFHDFLKCTSILTEASTSFSALLTETKVHPLLSTSPLRCTATSTEELFEYVIHVEPSLEPSTRPATPLCLPLHPFLA